MTMFHMASHKPFHHNIFSFTILVGRTVEDAGPYGLGWTPFCHIKQTDKSKFEPSSRGVEGAAPYRV